MAYHLLWLNSFSNRFILYQTVVKATLAVRSGRFQNPLFSEAFRSGLTGWSVTATW